MGLVYLFSLVVALGVLVVQIAMGGKGDGDAGADHADGSDANDVHVVAHGGGKPVAKDVEAAGTKLVNDASDFIAFFASLRFWLFAFLAFGISGSLLTFFNLATPVVVFVLAAAMAIGSGFFASLAYRFVARSAASAAAGDVARAHGSIGRVLVPVAKGKPGKIRIVLKGQSVDLLATTDDDELARGAHVLVEDVEEGVAKVSKRPSELA